MTHRSRSRHRYMDALDEGDLVIRATEETFEQWERCRSSPSTADCTVPTGDVIAEKTSKRDRIEGGFLLPSPGKATSSFGTLGVDYVRVTSMEDMDRGTGLAAASTSDSRSMVLFGFSVVSTFSLLSFWVYSRRKSIDTIKGIHSSSQDGCSEYGEKHFDGGEEKVLRNVSGNSINGSSDTSTGRTTPVIRREIQYIDGCHAHMSPLLVDEAKAEAKLSCPATAPPCLGEAILTVEEKSNEDETISLITPRSMQFTPQRSVTRNDDRSSSVHAMTLPPKDQCDQMVSMMSERFNIKKEDAGKIVAKECLKGIRKSLEFKEEAHRKLEAEVLSAKKDLQGVAWSIFLGPDFIRCMGLSLVARIVYPIVQKVWKNNTEQYGVWLVLDIFSSDVCGCSSYEQAQYQASSSLFSSLIPSFYNFIPSPFPEIGLVWCHLWALSFPITLAVIHRIISFIHANESAHNVLNLAACCFVAIRVASRDSTRSTFSFIFELFAGIAAFHSILSGMLLIFALSKGARQRVLRFVCAENQMESEIYLFALAGGAAKIISIAFAMLNGVMATGLFDHTNKY